LATNSLERALMLLKAVERTPGGLRHAEISRQLEIPKSTCSYILRRLEHGGYVFREDGTGRYRLGLATVALAYGALREIGIHSVAEPALYKLTSETGLSAGIGVLQGGCVLLVDRVEGPAFVNQAVQARSYRARSQRDVGRELPAHSTSLGKVLLAYLPREQVTELVSQRGLRRFTRKTNVSEARLMEELDLIRKCGWAIANGEAYMDLRALAAPVFDAEGRVRAAVALNGDPEDPAWNDFDGLVKLVQAAALNISRRAAILTARSR
jgi:IclR family KDG regulon transcriptional repressor